MDKTTNAFENLYNIIIKLRGEGGCPWDKVQTALTMRSCILEESYECVEAISKLDDSHTAEEIGDLFLVAIMICRIKEEEGAFSLDEVLNQACEKLIIRHPHVFPTVGSDVPAITAITAEEGLKSWENAKKASQSDKSENKGSVLDNVSKSIPPLERAHRFQKKAAKKGFEWSTVSDVWEKVKEEVAELGEEIASNAPQEKLEDEFGDILFSLVNTARFLKIDPSIALHRTNEKFARRFKVVETEMGNRNLEMKKENLQIMDEIWNSVKLSEK